MEILFKKITFKFKKSETQFINSTNKNDFPQLISKLLNELFDNNFTDLKVGRNYIIICKVEHRNTNKYETIMPMYCLNFNSKTKFKALFIQSLFKIDLSSMKNVQILYLPISYERKIVIIELLTTQYLNTMDLLEWGKLLKPFSIIEKRHKLWIINEVYINNEIKIIDYREARDNLNTFLRRINNTIEHYIDGKLVSKINILTS